MNLSEAAGEILQTNLLSKNSFGTIIRDAKMLVDLRNSAAGELRLDYSHGSELGMPITIYGAELFVNQILVHSIDFTNACQEAGLSIFPGTKIDLARWPLPNSNEFDCSVGCSVILRIFAN